MVLCVHNTREQLLYIAENRSGSSTLARITASEKFPELTVIPSDILYTFIQDNPNIKIIWPYRNPINRFISGMQIIHSGQLNSLDSNQTKYDITIKNFGIAPYHLYNSHIDHILIGAAYIAANGYNIRFLDLDNLSSHLSRLYPGWESLSGVDTPDNYHRVNSSSIPKKENIELFALYQSWIFSRNLTARYTWYEWMTPELNLYKGIHSFNVTRDIDEITHCLRQYLVSPITLLYNHISSNRSAFISTTFNRGLEMHQLNNQTHFWEEENRK